MATAAVTCISKHMLRIHLNSWMIVVINFIDYGDVIKLDQLHSKLFFTVAYVKLWNSLETSVKAFAKCHIFALASLSKTLIIKYIVGL